MSEEREDELESGFFASAMNNDVVAAGKRKSTCARDAGLKMVGTSCVWVWVNTKSGRHGGDPVRGTTQPVPEAQNY